MKSWAFFLSFLLFVAAQGQAKERVRPSFEGSHGLFSADVSWTVNEFKLDVLRGRIEFTPNDAVVCPSIRGIQTARVEQAQNQDFHWSGNDAPRNEMKTKDREQRTPGFFVDHDPALCKDGKACSPYYRDSWPNSDESADGFRAAGGSAQAASIIDYPYGWTQFEEISLETCMVCDETGQVFGCVDWGAIWPAVGERRLHRPKFHEVPSATFWRALRNFQKYYGADKTGGRLVRP